MEAILSYIDLVFVGFVALLPPVNPFGTALITLPLLKSLTEPERKVAARGIAFYCLLICLGSVILGSWIFRFFGISLPVVQLAGGLLICNMGWKLLSQKSADEAPEKQAPESRGSNVEDILFYPLAFPMTTGAGTISVLLTLSAHAHRDDLPDYLTNLSALLVASLAMALVIYLCYAYTPALVRKLGARGEQIVNQLSAFFVFCVGIQIGSQGLMTILKQQ